MIIFWDFDGTLCYSNPLWSKSVYKALKEVDCNTKIDFNDIRKCMAFGFTWHTPDNDYSDLIGEKWWNLTVNKITDDYLSLGVPENIARRAAASVPVIIKNPDNYTLYDDTVYALQKSVEFGNKNVILSNNYPDLSDVVNALGLSQYFDSIIVSANVGYDKPRTELFDYAKSKYPNDDYIMVGDNISADISGGKNAGMKTVLVHRGFCENADYCFDSLSDIYSLFKL